MSVRIPIVIDVHRTCPDHGNPGCPLATVYTRGSEPIAPLGGNEYKRFLAVVNVPLPGWETIEEPIEAEPEE